MLKGTLKRIRRKMAKAILTKNTAAKRFYTDLYDTLKAA